MRSMHSAALTAAILLIFAACGGAAGPGGSSTPTAPGGTPAGGPTGAPQATTGGGGGGGGDFDCIAPGTNAADGLVEGSIATTGAYPATWTFVVGNNGVNPSGTIGLTSDNNGPVANLSVDAAGNIEFGPITPGPAGEDIPNNLRQIFEGTGGQATFCLTSDQVPVAYICAISVDNDVTEPTAGTMLRVLGTLQINGTIPSTLGGLTITC